MSYQTEQKEALTRFLSENAERQFTVHALTEELRKEAEIGESTVYRLMKVLVEEGRVRRFMVDASRRVYYQYVGGGACVSHLHLKCISCGRLFHLDRSVSEFMQKQILATSRFMLDENKTMLFGTCHRCSGGTPVHA